MSNLIVSSYDAVQPELSKYLEAGAEPGLYLGYECLAPHYSHKLSGVTDWTGFPGSGKTYMALQMQMNLSMQYSQRHGLFVPDIGSDKEIYAKLIKMYTGKDFNDKYDNKITEVEMKNAMNWVMHHFVVLKKKDYKKGVEPIEFWEFIADFKDETGKLHTGLIDSWKNLKHIYSGREDSYLDETLSIRNEIAETSNVHFHTIAHAVKTEIEKDGQGKRRIPTAWDIKGGGSWYANGKNIITVDFPNKSAYNVDLYVSKTKPEDVGKVGNIIGKLKLDPKKGQYYETYNFNPCFAFEARKKKIEEPEIEFGAPMPISTEQDGNKAELPF